MTVRLLNNNNVLMIIVHTKINFNDYNKVSNIDLYRFHDKTRLLTLRKI